MNKIKKENEKKCKQLLLKNIREGLGNTVCLFFSKNMNEMLGNVDNVILRKNINKMND